MTKYKSKVQTARARPTSTKRRPTKAERPWIKPSKHHTRRKK